MPSRSALALLVPSQRARPLNFSSRATHRLSRRSMIGRRSSKNRKMWLSWRCSRPSAAPSAVIRRPRLQPGDSRSCLSESRSACPHSIRTASDPRENLLTTPQILRHSWIIFGEFCFHPHQPLRPSFCKLAKGLPSCLACKADPMGVGSAP